MLIRYSEKDVNEGNWLFRNPELGYICYKKSSAESAGE